MEGGDHPQVPIGKLTADALFHLQRGLVGEGHAEDVGGGDTQLLHQIQIPAGQGLGLAASRAGDDPDVALGLGGGGKLFPIQLLQIRFHQTSLFSMDNFPSIPYNNNIAQRYRTYFCLL